MSEILVAPGTVAKPAWKTRVVPYRQCSVCVLDTDDDPNMTFDEQGRSNYYHEYLEQERLHVRLGEEGRRLLEAAAERIRHDGRRKPYDCILGVSGGVDSSYLAWLAKQLGLRPLAVHFDNGWNSELAVKNIENIVQRLNIDLYTYVVNWEEFRDLQLAYLRASVIDIEALTDQAISAVVYRLAAQRGIKHILAGHNTVTESVLPKHWYFNKTDHVNIRAIHAAYGTVPLRTYPFMDLRIKKYHQLVRGVTSHAFLDLVEYRKDDVKALIQRELGWRDYGGKHHESIFTRFYQGYILPMKFGVDKRKAHQSNLIFSGQTTKPEALAELAKPIYQPEPLRQDKEFVTKKLGLSMAEFDEIMRQPPRPHTDFATEKSVYEMYRVLRPLRPLVNAALRVAGRRTPR